MNTSPGSGPSSSSPVVFLHGLCSSPESTKARYFREQLAPLGVSLVAPDLNRPTFETLTLTAQVAEIRRFLDEIQPASDVPFVCIGSSLGGLAALLFAHHHPERVQRLLLIAPATRFVGDRLPLLAGSTAEQWKERGYLKLLHQAHGRVRRLGYQLKEDADSFDFSALHVPHPILLLHGTDDEVVPLERSREFARSRPNVTLVTIPGGDHQLGGHLDVIWSLSRDFLL